jgi:serine/threonine-protein kinase RsbW
LGDHLRLDPELTDDLKTAVSEACNNVVVHAYGGLAGPLTLSIQIAPDSLDVSVRDQGSGIRRAAVADENRMGVGLAVISALAHRAEFESSPGEGTEVRMSFVAPALGSLPYHTSPATATIPAELSGEILASVAPTELLLDVMGRLVRAVAAGSHFAVDRFAGLNQLTNAIGALVAANLDGGSVGFGIAGRPKRIELEVGLLPTGSSARLFGGARPPASIEPLLQEVEAVAAAGGELLRAVIVEPRA